MKAQDIEIKKVLLAHNLDAQFSKARRKAYKGDRSDLTDFEDCFGLEFARVARNLDSARYQRSKRVMVKVGRSVLSGNAFFVTLTFKDKVLESTSEETRRRYVSRALRDIGFAYVANIDYGDQTQREHYHAIVEPYPFCLASWKNGKKEYQDMPDFREWCKKYGFVKIEKIGNTEEDEKKVAKYTAKLSRHALKKSTSKGGATAPRLIFSRMRFV